MSIEVIEVSPHISVPQAGSTVAGEVFRQLLQQAIRVADQANSQSVRMATDFAEVYRREQSVRLEYETKLREMRLLERQSTRYAEDLAEMLRKERERREELETALAIAREHHERWDGRGYPDGKKGDGISLAARIVSVADVFDALTSKRPYKTAWSIEEGMAAVIAGSGAQFDPEVVAVFQSLQADGSIERVRQEVATAQLD